jgi:hypothetical protein
LTCKLKVNTGGGELSAFYMSGADPDEDLLGRRVQVAFETVGDGEAIPYFTVTETDGR